MPYTGFSNWNIPNWGSQIVPQLQDWWRQGILPGSLPDIVWKQQRRWQDEQRDWQQRADASEQIPEPYGPGPHRNPGWQELQVPQGQYYKKPAPDYSDWGW